MFDPVRDLIARAVESRVCPAACVETGSRVGAVWRASAGALTYEPGAARADDGTVFDLASLTKVIATTSLTMRLVGTARLDLSAPVREWIPEWRGDDRAGVTVRDLLEHCSGLPAWAPLHQTCADRTEVLRAIAGWPLAYRPRRASVYSDLGFMLLGFVLEAAGGATLPDQWRAAVARGAAGTPDADLTFGARPEWLPRVAPARADSRRGYLLRGDVDDDNAWTFGGGAGHAGLFGTVTAVGAFARTVLGARAGVTSAETALASRDTVRVFLSPSAVPASSRACGWDLMRPTSSCGSRMSPAAFGHTGFTGTSLWIDPERDLYVVLLTNRVHPTAGSSDPIQALRRAVHDAVLDETPPTDY